MLGLTKATIESAFGGELDDHRGYGKHDTVGRDGGNFGNGKRSKTVLIEVPRDRNGSGARRRVVGGGAATEQCRPAM